jgi:diguanylate cyclase
MKSETKRNQFGRGFNSIPVRFGLMSLVFTSICAATLYFGFVDRAAGARSGALFAILLVVLTPSAITYWAASKLVRSIQALRRSTEAIAAGDLTQPVEVDCACEVGGLADSFQKMVARLNSSVTRMNLLAHTDAITGLPNRSVINHILGLAEARARCEQCQAALFFIDLDAFKAVNDNLGHEAGDELLRQVSQRLIMEGLQRTFDQVTRCANGFGELCGTCPDDIVVSRFAGDEFVVLIPGRLPVVELETMAARVIACLSRPFSVMGQDVRIGASIGVARLPEDTASPTELLNFADIAMYQAKQRGKNGFVFFNETFLTLTSERRRIEQDLRAAIASRDFVLHYQPKIDCENGRFAGVEALLRWEHPERGTLSPAVFVPIAEDSGLMRDLGRVVFDLAFAQAAQWSKSGLRVPIAVNVSPAQFDDPALVPELLARIRRHDIDPHLIDIEITESMAMADCDTACARLEALRNAGVQTSIDDFGVGFSNLWQLSKLPVGTLKIDKSMIDQIGQERGEAIIRATIDMAHALGHKVVAEGIETLRQSSFLIKTKCDYMQGFLFGRPMSSHDLMLWMAARQANPLDASTRAIRSSLS